VDREAELKVEQESAERVVTSLKGAARFDVVPNAMRAFEVRTRDVRVRVLGTRFAVQELGAGQTQIAVERGKVQVEWLGGSRTLAAGESGVFPPAAAEREIASPVGAAEPEPAPQAAPGGPKAPRVDAPPSCRA